MREALNGCVWGLVGWLWVGGSEFIDRGGKRDAEQFWRSDFSGVRTVDFFSDSGKEVVLPLFFFLNFFFFFSILKYAIAVIKRLLF